MPFTDKEILETVRMVELETLDIRTTTLGISLLDCADPDLESACEKVYAKVVHHASKLGAVAKEIEEEYGVPIVNQRIAVTPISWVAAASNATDLVPMARALDAAAAEVSVDFIGGFSAYVDKGFTNSDRALMDSIPAALAETERVCASVALGSTKTGINMDAVLRQARGRPRGREADRRHRRPSGARSSCASAMSVQDNPFVAGAHIGVGEPETVLNVGVSGPGVVRSSVSRHRTPNADLLSVAEVGEAHGLQDHPHGRAGVGREAARQARDVLRNRRHQPGAYARPWGTPSVGHPRADRCRPDGRAGNHRRARAPDRRREERRSHGLVLRRGPLRRLHPRCPRTSGMIQAVARRRPLAREARGDDVRMLRRARHGGRTGQHLRRDTMAGIIADEMAIGMVNQQDHRGSHHPRCLARGRGRPSSGAGLLGTAIVQDPGAFGCRTMAGRGGRIPAPLQGYKN